MQGQGGRIRDTLYLICAAILVCAFGVGAYALADIYHVSPLAIFCGLISVGFFVGAGEDYRKEFRSPRFVAFVIGWLVINVLVVVFVVADFGWLWLIPALLLEQFLFYMSAYWLFGVNPPPKKRWPFQRNKSSGSDEM